MVVDGAPPDKVSYWHQHYAQLSSLLRPVARQSAFADFVRPRLDPEATVVDIGCGDGRDALFFASAGHRVLAVDAAQPALDRLNQAAESRALRISALRADLGQEHDVRRLRREIARTIGTGPRWVYARFFLHAAKEPARQHFFRLARELLEGRRGELVVEFRGLRDSLTRHHFGEDHHREYLDEEVVRTQLERLGATTTYAVSGRGLAPYEDEDPGVARIACVWRPPDSPGW